VKVLLVGLGSIGRRHLGNLALVEPSAEVLVLRQASASAPDDQPANLRVVRRLEDALAFRPDAALLCSPAPFHVEVGLALARQGCHLFIEKPLADALTGVERLLACCRDNNLVLLVGYNLRFHPAVQLLKQEIDRGRIGKLLTVRAEVGQYLPHWRPTQDYRTTVSARRELGGGALLELSHELDLVRWLGGEVRSVQAVVERLSDLKLDVEDVADILVRFESGALGNVHLDMLQQPPTRSCKLVGSEGTLLWDAFVPGVRWYDNRSAAWTMLGADKEQDRNRMYVAELQHFFACIAGREQPLVDGQAGLRVLEMVLAARESSATGRSIVV